MTRFDEFNARLEPLDPVSLAEGTVVDVAVPIETKKSTTARLLALMESRPGIDPSFVDEWQRAVESARLPMRSGGCFDDIDG